MIKVSLPDHNPKEMKSDYHEFDFEAMIHYENALYIFSKSKNAETQNTQNTASPKKERKTEININYDVGFREKTTSEKKASELLKEATAQKQNGNFDKAVELLRAAYDEIAKTDIQYDVKVFLRLPLYLQKAKRNDEAWREFNLLITHGFPNQPTGEAAYESIKSTIYDKMRLFLQREGRNKLAINYGIFSYLADLKGRYLSGQEDELFMQYFNQYSTDDRIDEIVGKLVKKANKEDIKEELCVLVHQWIEKIQDVYEDEVQEGINSLIQNSQSK